MSRIKTISLLVMAAFYAFAGLIGLASDVWLTDLGPFRAVRREILERLDMEERTYGWPSEMIIKASKPR